MPITLYRLTDFGDTIINIDDSEKVIFNDTDDIKSNNAFITRYRIADTIGIGNNQAAEQDLGDHQDLGSVELIYILEGFVSVRDSASDPDTNPITKLKNFSDNPKTNANFFHGRFGLALTDMIDYSLFPVSGGDNQIGLIFKSIDWYPLDYERHPLRADFTIKLITDKGDGT